MRVRSEKAFPADDADARTGADALVCEQLGQRPRAVAGLVGQAEILEQVSSHRQWCDPSHP
jgi:hypothetical protein